MGVQDDVFIAEDEVAAIAGIDVVPTILDLACSITGMRYAVVARVTETRWLACGVRDDLGFGLGVGDELRIETTVCSHIRQHRRPVLIRSISTDPGFSRHPVATLYGLESYLSVPIFQRGRFFGTLCAIDTEPARHDLAEALRSFEMFARLIGLHLDAADRLERSEHDLRLERERAHLRDQFMAVLGHDLRTPLASVGAGVQALRHRVQDPRSQMLLDLMQRSIGRMADLIGNVLDLARGQLGGGLSVVRDAGAPLAPVLEQVIAEVRSTVPGCVIESDLRIDVPVSCDRSRMAQLLSNLLVNAATHGAPGEPVEVGATLAGDELLLWVVNRGQPIDPALLPQLFQPFFRSPQSTEGGLGLGLYIVAEIARAHGGSVSVQSTSAETRFTVRIPGA